MYTTAMITISMADAMMITKTNGTTTVAMCMDLHFHLMVVMMERTMYQRHLATLIKFCTSMYIVCMQWEMKWPQRNSIVHSQAHTHILTNCIIPTCKHTHNSNMYIHTYIQTDYTVQTYLSCTRARRQRSVAPTRGQLV